MARGDDPASATTSFFIVHRRRQLARRQVHRVRPRRRRHGRRRRDRAGAAERRGAGDAHRAEAGADRQVSAENVRPSSRARKSRAERERKCHAEHRRDVRGVDGLMADRRSGTVVVACSSSAAALVSTRAHVDDWPQWRGPRRDGVSAETGLLKEWPAAVRRWRGRSTGPGEGYSSFSVAGGRLFTLGARGRAPST